MAKTAKKTSKKAAKKTAKKAAKKTAKKVGKKRGPKDRSYVNQGQPHEVRYAKKRKAPAKKFGGKRKKSGG
jgi:hypothetical protein